MNENTETTVADRTKCAEWCGKEYGARGVPFRRSCGFPMYFEHGAAFNVAVKDNEPAWCSIACRDARLPPVAAPAAPKIEVKATVGGMCPLCGVAVPSTHIHVCGAAPAAHVERRKGQRWEFRSGDAAVASGVSDIVNGEFVILSPGGQPYLFGPDDPDVGRQWHMLADAAPEPAKLHTCRDHCGALHCDCSKCGHDPALYRPAHEAPKAAPVLEWSFTDKEGREHRFATGIERDAASRAYGSWIAEQTGKPYAGPERLPRPQLAADWVEDCLPEAGR